MTRRKPPRETLPASVAAVAHLAAEAQIATGRPMPQAELCELLTEAREIEFRRFLEHSGAPRIGPAWHRALPTGPVRWTPRAYAGLHGLTGQAADLFTDMAETLQRDHD